MILRRRSVVEYFFSPRLVSDNRLSQDDPQKRFIDRSPAWLLALIGAVLLWLSQPPVGWPLVAWFALVPWLLLATRDNVGRRDMLWLYLANVGHWGLTMQGLRHAHPAMYATWIVFAFYLGCYGFMFVVLVRDRYRGKRFGIPLWIWIPVIGTGLECIRNYLLTGISAAMLGHSQATVPTIVQVADAFGSYGITFVILLVNAAIHHAWCMPKPLSAIGCAGAIVATILIYGTWRLNQADQVSQPNPPPPSIALIGRDEPIVFVQDADRELKIFDNYFRDSVVAAQQVAQGGGTLAAIIWPESMYTGAQPWVADTNEQVPLDPAIQAVIDENQNQFQRRSEQVQAAIRRITGQAVGPDLIVGCSVVQYDEPPKLFSGIVHVGPGGKVVDWYGKTHLVMFGEYIPLIDYLPFVYRWVPPGMGIERGGGPVAMRLGELIVSPNICIETAVERVTPAHVMKLANQSRPPDIVINVTNDGWFDGSSIVDHHLRCTQLVAVTCRRPILIAANGGPTVWIDSAGRVVKDLAYQKNGFVIANPVRDGRWGLYQSIGDWPARIMAGCCVVMVLLLKFWVGLVSGTALASRQLAVGTAS